VKRNDFLKLLALLPFAGLSTTLEAFHRLFLILNILLLTALPWHRKLQLYLAEPKSDWIKNGDWTTEPGALL